MDMQDYLECTTDAILPMFNAIRDSSVKAFELDTSMQHWVHLENFLLGQPHNGWGPVNFEDWKKDMGVDPTVDSVRFWRAKLEAIVAARHETINVLCSSILMIAQNGIKLVLGRPNSWRSLEGTLLSSQNECLLKAIWHSRNLGAHVEGLSAHTPSFAYFEDIKNRRGIDLKASTTKLPCKYVVKELLGWIETDALPIADTLHTVHFRSPYTQDMIRIGQLSTITVP